MNPSVFEATSKPPLDPSIPRDHKDAWAWALGAGLFLLNALMVSPYLGWQDSGEFLAATATLGISHPGGQPLYHLLGKLFLLLPFGTPAWKLGLMSALAASAASVLLFLLMRRLTRLPDAWLALLTAAWSLSLPWWTQASTVETYALGLFQVFFTVWALSQPDSRRWPLFGLALGLAVVYRPTYVLGFIALPLLFLETPREQRLRGLVGFFLAFFIASRLPWYLAIRSAANPPVEFTHLSGFLQLVRHVMGLDYAHHLGAQGGPGFQALVMQYLRLEAVETTPVGIGLATLGLVPLVRDWKKMPLFLWAALLWAVGEFLLVMTVPYPQIESHQVLWPFAFDALLAALGLSWLIQTPFSGTAWKRWTGLLLGLWVFFQCANAGALLFKRADRSAEDFGRCVLNVLEPNAVYFPSEDNDYFPVIGVQRGYGIRPDVRVAQPGEMTPSREGRLLKAIGEGAPVYVSKLSPGLPKEWVLIPVGPLWKIAREPAWLPRLAMKTALRTDWDGVRLGGFSVPGSVRAGTPLDLTYHFEKAGSRVPASPLQVVVLFVDKDNQYVEMEGGPWLHDIHDFLNGWLPPTAMKAGKKYVYKRTVFIPPDFPRGNYRVLIGLQKPAPPQQGNLKASGEFYAAGSWQASWRYGGRGGWDATQKMVVSKNPNGEKRFLPIRRSVKPVREGTFVEVDSFSVD